MELFPFTPPQPAPLTGREAVADTGATVADFWRFAMSNLRMNNVRGYLAEFLVARAVGAPGARIEWDAFDVLSPDGTRIEVKTSAYIQAWEQRAVSRIVFSGLNGRTWTTAEGLSAKATYNADVYVFAVETAKTHRDYDPLCSDQWDFYVVARPTLERLGYRSISLPTLEKLTGAPLPYSRLASAIADAARVSREEDEPCEAPPRA